MSPDLGFNERLLRTSPFTLTPEDVVAAAERLKSLLPPTPYQRSAALSEWTGAEVWLKFENVRRTGSFKERGALHALLRLSEDECMRGVITMSAGNHGQALAFHARRLGIQSTVVMPQYTPTVKVERTRAAGAEVVLAGRSLEETILEVRTRMASGGRKLVHPYDDPDVMAGQGTLALELRVPEFEPEVVIVPVGGGGLIGGVVVGTRRWPRPPEVVGVQAASFPSVAARRSGRRLVFAARTVAEGVAVKEPSSTALALIEQYAVGVEEIAESDIERAVLWLLEHERTCVEGAGALGVALLLRDLHRFQGRKVAVILTGGNIDLPIFATIIQRGLVRTGRLVRLRIRLHDVPGMLAKVAECVARTGANIVEVRHQRSHLNLTAQETDLELELLTRGPDHIADVLQRLGSEGFPVTRLDDGLPSEHARG